MSAFGVLAEPHRRHILDLLREGERSVGELVGGLGLSQPGVSKHLRVLREAGLVRVRVDAQRRLYALRPQPLDELHEWLEPYRRLWASTWTPSSGTWTNPGRRRMADRPRADGTVEQGPDGSTRVRFTRRLPHPIDRVWEALTDPGELSKWWGDVELDLVEGGRFALRWRNTDEHGDAATLDGAITKLDPPRSLEITADWGMTGSPGLGSPTTLTWELEPDGDHTLLHFTNTVAGPADPRTAAGWHLHLDALAAVLAGGEVDIAHPEPLFAPLRQAYAEKYPESPPA